MNKLTSAVILIIAINCIVLPNAQQELLGIALIFGAVLGLRGRKVMPRQVILLILGSSLVTLFYGFVGTARGAPSEALVQAILIYIVFPILWLLVIDLTWRLLETEQIVNALAYFGIAAAATVAVYMFLFLNYGPQAVAFFGSGSNVHIEDDYSGVIMHVSGSLVFLGAAFSAEPSVLRRLFFSTLTLSSLALAALASGRTSAVLGLAIGVSILLLISIRQIKFRHLIFLPVVAIAAVVVIYSLNFFIGVDAIQLIGRHMDKILGGDLERPTQIKALVEGIEDTWFLGAGHGIGVDYIRSDLFNWRYEAVFVALFYKLGFLGAIVVISPIFLALGAFGVVVLKGRIRKYDAFFGSALVSCFIAGFTNPYPEAFAFQWMYLIPVYYFLYARKVRSFISLADTIGNGRNSFRFYKRNNAR